MSLRMHYGGAEGHGGLAEAMWDPDGSDAINGSLLDRGIRHLGSSRVRGVPGECARDQESARAQKRRAGESMADEAAHLRAVAELVSAAARNSHAPNLLAATQRSDTRSRATHPSHAESPHADEYSVSQRTQ